MRYFHLTILLDGKHRTVYASSTSIEAFLAMEGELGRECHVLYSREISREEYEHAKSVGL